MHLNTHTCAAASPDCSLRQVQISGDRAPAADFPRNVLCLTPPLSWLTSAFPRPSLSLCLSNPSKVTPRTLSSPESPTSALGIQTAYPEVGVRLPPSDSPTLPRQPLLSASSPLSSSSLPSSPLFSSSGQGSNRHFSYFLASICNTWVFMSHVPANPECQLPGPAMEKRLFAAAATLTTKARA